MKCEAMIRVSNTKFENCGKQATGFVLESIMGRAKKEKVFFCAHHLKETKSKSTAGYTKEN